MWDGETGREQTTIHTGKQTRSLTSDHAGALVAAVVWDGALQDRVDVKVWDAETGVERWNFPETVSPTALFPGLEFSPDGSRLAVILPGRGFHFQEFGNPSGRVKVWDLQTGEQTQTLAAQGRPVVDAVFSPDGRRLASLTVRNSTDMGSIISEIGFWDVAAGRQVLNVSRRNFDPDILFNNSQPAGSRLLRFSPDGEHLVVAGHPLPMDGGETFLTLDAAPLSEAPRQGDDARRTADGWGEVVDPSGECAFQRADGKLTISVPDSYDFGPDAYDSFRRIAGRVLQPVEGDFTLQVKTSTDFKPVPARAGDAQFTMKGAGLVLWIDGRNYIRLQHAVPFTPDGPQEPLTVEWLKNGMLPTSSWGSPELSSILKGRSVYLRLERRKGKVQARVSADGRKWIDVGPPVDVNMPAVVRVGVDAVNSSNLPFTAEFEDLQWIRKSETAPDRPGGGEK